MKKIIFILAAIFIISDCSADARVLEQLKRSKVKASAKAKNAVSKVKTSKKKTRNVNCIPKNTKPKETVTKKDLDIKNDLAYLPNDDKPFTGKHEQYHSNGNKYTETDYKDGKKNGLLTTWDEYEHKVGQLSYFDGEQAD
jgi:antitoxin component YwqK of YwqJK toxin-antitoxin module